MTVYIVKAEPARCLATRYNTDKMTASIDCDDLFLLDSSLTRLMLPGVGRKRRGTNIHEINKTRSIDGEYHHLFKQLKAFPERFHSYTRMNLDTFNYILNIVESKLTKTWCNFHEPILPEERLVVTLR